MGTAATGAACCASAFFSILTVSAACTNPATIPTGFASPCPVFSLSATTVTQAQTLTLSATPQPGTDYIYTTAYVSQGAAWNPYTLSGNNAYPSYSSALASLTLSSAQLSSLSLGTHYAVVWDWLWDATAGCYKGPGLNQCNTGQWRVQSFSLTSAATPTPSPTPYTYSQSSYTSYTYSQSSYYAYSQSSYYGYSQSAYVSGSPPWSGILDPSRAVDWSQAGATITNRTANCATLGTAGQSPTFVQNVTAAQISSAIASCTAGQVVFLNAGTYNLAGGITFGGHSNVTLRGEGANQTLLVFTGNYNCRGFGSLICIGNNSNPSMPTPSMTTNWTGTAEGGAGTYPVGATHLVVGSTAGMSAGNLLILDQLDDASDTGNIFVCGSLACSSEGQDSSRRANRGQQQMVKVVSITDGTHVVVTPGLYMPNWRSSQAPGISWVNSNMSGDGVENLSLNGTSAGIGANAGANVVMLYVSNSWVSGIRSVNDPRAHVWLYESSHNTVRDSYFFGTLYSASTSYGVEAYAGSADNLVENDILEQIAGGNQEGGGGVGNVWGYNFSINDKYTVSAGWMIPSNIQHATGVTYSLTEGNDGLSFEGDIIHGTHHLNTAFRNYFEGDVWNNPPKTNNTDLVHLWAFSRYYNIIGNVLGRTGYYNTYESNIAGNPTAIFSLGSGGPVSDSLVKTTLMRWGNYDTVHGSTQWNASEVPSSLSLYANSVPASQALPASFYLSAKPAFWGSMPYPAIGPDVSGGTLSGVSGHAYMIPARACWTNTMGGVIGTSGLLNFNAANCYP